MTTPHQPTRLLMVMPYEQLAQKAVEAGFDVWAIWDPTLRDDDYLSRVASHCRELRFVSFDDAAELARAVTEMATRNEVDWVLHLGAEESMLTVAEAARTIGKALNPPEVIADINDKERLRRLLTHHGLSPVRWAPAGSLAEVPNAVTMVGTPAIVKPTGASGSRGIARIDDPVDLPEWIDRVRDEGLPGPYIVEEVLQGPEFSVETLTVADRHHLVGITAKHTTGAPYFVETGHDFPAPLSDAEVGAIRALVTAVLTAAQYQFGPAHTEIVLTDQGPRVVEAQTRLGGDRIPVLVKLATGLDFEALVFEALAGRPVVVPIAAQAASVRFFSHSAGRLTALSGLEAAETMDCVRELRMPFSVGSELPRTTSSGTRHGHVVAVGGDVAEASANAAAAQRLISVEVADSPSSPDEAPFHDPSGRAERFAATPDPRRGKPKELPAEQATVLLVGATDGHVEKAKLLGARVVLLQHPEKTTARQQALADDLIEVDYTDWEQLRPVAAEALTEHGPAVVLSLTEGGLENAARLRESMGLPGSPWAAVHRLRDKLAMREHLAGHHTSGLRWSAVHSAESLARFAAATGYPFIVKPTSATAGFGLIRVDGPADLPQAWARIRHLTGKRTDRGSTLFRVDEFIAEEYVDGPEYSVEAFSFGGRHLVVAITEKTSHPSTFAELGHAVPARVTSRMASLLRDTVKDFLDAVGVTDGPSHTEVRLGSRGAVIIEGHNRVGGDRIHDLVEIAFGIDLVSWGIAWPLGLLPEVTVGPVPVAGACTRFLHAESGVVTDLTGPHELAKAEGVVAATVSVGVGDRVHALRDNWDRIGQVITRGTDTNDAISLCENAIRDAYRIAVVPDDGVARQEVAS
ncbi:MAG: ATP-grasp domain-containing protein [Dermatophilaceae bacterium]